MKMRKYIWIWTLSVLVGCSNGGDGNGNGNPNPDPDPVAAPSAATLVFPDDDEECTEGEILSEATSRVDFMWNASQNTDSYVVHLTDLNTGTTSTFTASTNNKLINLLRGNPYEWFVESKRNGTNATANSATWRFYNAGLGVENYAPFPAEAINPARGINLAASTSTVTLEWIATDLDDDIVSYEVFFGTETTPTTSLVATNDNFINDVAVSSGNTYYWRVITIDELGNNSISSIFDFKIL